MVFLVLSRRGWEQLAVMARSSPVSLWVNGGVLSDEELSSLRAYGMDITNFQHCLDASDPTQVREAVETIELHHAGSVVWIENETSAVAS